LNIIKKEITIKNKTKYEELLKILKKYKKWYFLIFLNSIIVAILDVVPIFLIKEIIDSSNSFLFYGLIFVGLGALRVLFSFFSNHEISSFKENFL